MGSKMSFGRGSSDQNTVSELAPVPPHPRSSNHAPSDCKQLPEDKRCDKEDLESGWKDKVKAAEPNEPELDSQSSGALESDCHVDFETVGRANCRPGEHMLSQVGIDTKSDTTCASMCSSTTDSHGKLVEAHKKRGRPRKTTTILTEDKRGPDTAGLNAVQYKEVSTTIPLPVSLENHNNDALPNAVDGYLMNASPHNDMTGDMAPLEDKVQGDVPLLQRKKRGRPKKGEIPAFPNTVSEAAAAAGAPVAFPHTNNVRSTSRRLRSRGGEQDPSAQDEKSDSVCREDVKRKEPTTETSYTFNLQGVKRRRRKLHTDQQVPAKVSKLEDSQEALLSKDCEGRVGTDNQVELSTDKQITDGKGDHLSLQSGEGQEQLMQLKEDALPQRKLHSQPEPEVIPTEGLNSLNLVSPTQMDDLKKNQAVDVNNCGEVWSKTPDTFKPPTNAELQKPEPSSTDLITSSEQMPESVGIPPAVKDENIEIELDHINPVSQSNNPASFQRCANAKIKSEGPSGRQCTFRRKRGGKRRRRINNVLLPREDIVENHEASSDTQQKQDCEEEDKEVDSNVIYTKKGPKTLLKCTYCGRTFKFLSQFVIHQRIHTGERPFKCPECDKGFSKNSNLNLHLKTHRKSSIYQKCPFCKIKFSCSEYASHMKLHAHEIQDHNNRSEKRCRGGDRENNQGLHRAASPEKKEKKVCQYCGKTFPFQSALIRHVRVHTGEKPYKCDICGKAFGQAYFLRVHELTHWSVKRYNCTRCEKSFTHYSNAKNHTCRPLESGDDDDLQPNRRVRPSLTYTCHICKNVFDHLQEFNSHMREHTGAKLYRCLYCDKLFGVLTEFNAHRAHCSAERNTSCSGIKKEDTMSLIQYTVPALRCSSGHTSTSTSLTAEKCQTQKKQSQSGRKKRSASSKKPFQSTVIPAHQLSHFVSKLNKLDTRSDPRKYLCPSCGRLFRHMGRLRAHMLTHAPGQSYPCACCGKTLGNWKKLWRHQRIHRQRRGRFTCPQCGQGFRFVEPYKKHMSEHPEFQWIQVRPKKVFLPYQCEQCRSSFKTLDLLFSHQLCHSSTQDMHKDFDLDLFLDDHTTQSNKTTFSPSSNSTIAALCSAPEENHSPLSPLHKYPESVSEESQMISFVHSQSLDLDSPPQNYSYTHSIYDGQTSVDRIDETDQVKPITPLRTVKRHMTQKVSISSEGPSDGVQCAVCGNTYQAISDLYQHYLQHARGQV